MSRRITVSASALLLLGSGLAAPAASAIVPGSASFAPAPASWTDCDLEVLLGCPASPEITSVTAEVSQIHVSWAWPGETQMPSDITELVVRVSPGDLEVVVAHTESTVSIAELEPETEYSVTVLAVSGFQLGVPSNPATVATLAATLDEDSAEGNAYGSEGEALKPQASPGDVDGLIVTLKDDHSTESVAANAASDLPIAGVAAEQTQDLGAGNAKIELSQGVSESDAQAIIVDLESDPRVESVEVDRRVYLNAFPSDPPDDTKWASNNLWGLYGSNGVGIASDKSTMNSIWTQTQGSGTVVAVLDTGSSVHPDLDTNYIAGYDFVSSGSALCRTGATDSDGDYVDTSTYGALGWDSNPLDPGDWTTGAACTADNSSWHGTHVAGTIAAVANNSQYIAGVAPESQIQPVRVLSMDGGLTSDITAAITWASGGTVGGVTNNSTPADVINLSLGGSGSCSSSWQTAIDAAVALGSVVVVAAGNSNQDASNFVPANCDNVITVAALESGGARSSFSNFGSTVEIAAPGSGIYSTMNTGTNEPVGPTVASYNGTSMAAPHVAGVAALLRSKESTLTPAEILERITATAKPFPTGTGRDCSTSTCGAGMLQASGVSLLHVSSVSPNSGSTAGGTSVTLGGWELTSPSSVTFGGIAGTVTASSQTSITVTTPAASAGAVDIVVTTSAGSFTTASGFTFITPSSSGGSSDGSSGGSSSSSDSSTGEASTAPDEISVTESAVTSHQVSGAGEFSAIDATGAPVALRSAGLTPTGFVIEGSDWGVTGSGALNFTQQTLTTGDAITISGAGLQRLTTVGVYVLSEPTWVGGGIVSYENNFTTSFGIPALPPGQHTLQINIVLQGGVKNSLAIGFTSVGPSVATPQTPNTVAPVNLGNIVGFRSGSAKLSKPAKAKLAKMAALVEGANTTGSITAYYNKRGTAKSKRLAKERATSIEKYLAKMGVTESLNVTSESGRTAKLRRSAIIRLSTDAGTTAPVKNERISSLIVRYAKGVSPTVNGTVRGANLVTGRVGKGMTLGPYLGLRMYRVDLAQPVTLAVARKASAQISTNKGVEFAEPDRIVTSFVTAN